MIDIAPLSDWKHKGKFRKLSPCGRYQIEKAILEGRKVYYGLPSPRKPYLGPGRETAEQAWGDCSEHSEKVSL